MTVIMTTTKTTTAMTTKPRALCFSSSMDEISTLLESETVSLDILFPKLQDRIIAPSSRFTGSKNPHTI
jgi:hypothetical protein